MNGREHSRWYHRACKDRRMDRVRQRHCLATIVVAVDVAVVAADASQCYTERPQMARHLWTLPSLLETAAGYSLSYLK